MNQEIQQQISLHEFKASVDSWIKEINGQVSDFKDVPQLLHDNVENIDHNYELIHQLKKEMHFLREEVKTLKLIQTVMLKKND